MFSALLLELAEDKHHFHGWNEAVEQDPGKYFASDGK